MNLIDVFNLRSVALYFIIHSSLFLYDFAKAFDKVITNVCLKNFGVMVSAERSTVG